MQDVMQDAETLWSDFATPIRTADDYINSLRGRRMNVFFMGERVAEPADHPVIRPSINAMAETYRVDSARPAHRHLFPALRGSRRHWHMPLGDVRHRCAGAHRLSPAVPRVPAPRAESEHRHRRSDDRSEGRSLQGAEPAIG